MKHALCKKQLLLPIGNHDVFFLAEGKEYQFEIKRPGWFRIYEREGKYQDIMDFMFKEHFYTEREYRKIKLGKLN